MKDTPAPPAANPYLDPEYARAAMAQSDRMRGSTVSVRDRVIAKHGRPESARRPRARGTGSRPKAQAARSSAKSGDSGEDSEPPGRLCACECGESIDHRPAQARFLNDQHAAANRQRRKRRLERGSLTARRDYTYLVFDEKKPLDLLRLRIEQGCRCNGHHIADPEDAHCIKCGHDRRDGSVSAKGVSARSAETRRSRAEGWVA